MLLRFSPEGAHSSEEIESLIPLKEVDVMAQQDFAYRRFQVSATIAPLQPNRGLVTIDITTSDPERVADPGTERFLHLERWAARNDPAFLQVVVDECNVAVDHYVDNVADS